MNPAPEQREYQVPDLVGDHGFRGSAVEVRFSRLRLLPGQGIHWTGVFGAGSPTACAGLIPLGGLVEQPFQL